MENDQQGVLAEEQEEEEETSCKKQKQNITLVEQLSDCGVSEIFVDKVKSTTLFQHINHMDSSIVFMDLHATELKAQSSNSTNSTSAAAERRGKKPFIREISFLEKARVELQNMGRYRKDPFKIKKQTFFGTVKEASKGFNYNMHESKETSSLMANVDVTESSDECNAITSCNPKAKRSLLGVRRQKNGRYGAVITDRIRHKQVWLGTFDAIEEASQAYLSKKSEFKKLSQQGNEENKPKKNLEQIQQPESPVKASLSVTTDNTLDTASHVSRRKKRIDSHKTTITHIVEVHKNKTSGKEPESSKETSCLMVNVNVTELSDECNTTTSCNPKAKRSSLGVRRQKNGKYGAVITDRIRHKQVWLGTFDTIEEASHAYLSKKSEFEKLSQRGNEENKPKKNLEQIQPPESPVVASLSAANDQTLDTASHVSRRNERIDSPKTTIHIVEVHKNKTSEKEPESSKETSCLMASVNATESSDECDTTTSCNPKAKRSLLGVRRQKNGRYGAVITDRIRHKQVWLGTFDTIEEASHAYLSKKSKFEKLSQQGNENKPKKNLEQIQQPESPVVASLSVANDQTLDTASHVSRRNERIESHKTTHIVEVHKNKMSEKEPESSKETSRLMENVNVTKSSDECNTTTSCNPKAKRHLLGVRKQKNGRYGAVITDRIRHKKVRLGTFDTIEEASQAYLSKKSEIEKLCQQGNKENKPKNCDQIQQPESPVVASLSVANDQTLDTASVGRRNKRIDSQEKTTYIVGVHKRKDSGKYTSEIRNPISNKRIWLGTFGTAEEASQAYKSKKLEFQKLVKEKQQQCTNKQTHSKQDAGKEKLVNVKQGHENVNCEPFQFESAGGSEIDVPISNPSNGGTDQRIDSHEIGTAEEALHAYQSKIFDFQSSKKVELLINMPTDYSAGENQEGQKDDEDLWMGKWVQLPGNRAVKFSLELGLPIIDNYGSLLGEFSALDDLSIC